MARVPNARLLMKCKPFASESSRQMMLARLERIGIDPRRADLLPLLPSTSEHLRTYSMVDIALDSFPYAGTTTTCEALYMGVPVVTLGVAPPAAFHAHNVSVSLLSRIPLMRDFIATNDDEYVDLAARWALDTQRLAEVRRSLRAAMLESPLCDGERSTRSLEEIYTRMWARWCERPARSPRQ
jgi:predicted O-linked N-acetylglucosamine transferase (SPINDLY family)